MPFDAVFLHALLGEINTRCSGARVEKIYQPEKDEVMLHLHTAEGNCRLLVSASVNHPRVQITSSQRENPLVAPMFCMLLRKHLVGAKMLSCRQLSFERVADLSFSVLDELGEESTRHLILEVLGRQTNLVLTDGDYRIIDSLHRSDFSEKATRQIFPGVMYSLPDSYGKINPLEQENPLEHIAGFEENQPTEKVLISKVMGLSPLLARELIFRAKIQPDCPYQALDFTARKRLSFELSSFITDLKENHVTPYLQYFDSDKPKDFTVVSVAQYGGKCQNVAVNSFCELLDTFYEQKERAERLKNRSAQVAKFCQNTLSKLRKKIDAQREELATSKDREKYRLYGELITANIHLIEKGATFAMLPNYYEEGMPLLKVPLNPQHNAARNAQDNFKKYAKLKTAEKMLTEQIAFAENEMTYLESVFDCLNRCETESEIEEIRNELIAGGYLHRGNREKVRKTAQSKPIEYQVSGGFKVLVGRNNVQNDFLSMKTARKTDLWFHVLGSTGSHAVLFTEGREVPDDAITDAAELAALHSSSRMGNNVGVTVTEAGNLKKPNGAKPGFVIYSTSRTVYVTPDEKKAETMKKGH